MPHLCKCWNLRRSSVLLLLSSDSLYFNRLHLSTSSLRVVSHQRRRFSLCPIQYHTPVLTISAYFQPKPSKLLARVLLLPSFCSPLFIFLSLLSAVHTLKSVENAGLALSRWFQSTRQSSQILFDTVRWPGKLKTQLKWQSRGQLFCISKALLWPFYTNYIR